MNLYHWFNNFFPNTIQSINPQYTNKHALKPMVGDVAAGKDYTEFQINVIPALKLNKTSMQIEECSFLRGLDLSWKNVEKRSQINLWISEEWNKLCGSCSPMSHISNTPIDSVLYEELRHKQLYDLLHEQVIDGWFQFPKFNSIRYILLCKAR